MQSWALQTLQPLLFPGCRAWAHRPQLSNPFLCRTSPCPVSLSTLCPARGRAARKPSREDTEPVPPEQNRAASQRHHCLAIKELWVQSQRWLRPPAARPQHPSQHPPPSPRVRKIPGEGQSGGGISHTTPRRVSGPKGWGLFAGTVQARKAMPCRGSLWFSSGPEQEDVFQVAAGASLMGLLQPKVQAIGGRDSGSEEDVANGKPGVKSEHLGSGESSHVLEAGEQRTSPLITGSWALPPPLARLVASSPPSRPPRGRPRL